ALLLHELVHLKNGDHLVRLFELIVGIVFWWLPIVRSIGRQLRDCEESRCDAAVVAHLPQARRDYAQLLLDVLDFARPLPQSALAHVTAMSFANTLEQRLRAILVVRPKVHRNRPALAAALVLACAVLPCELRYGLVGGTAPPEQQAISSAAAEPRAATTGAGVRGLSNLIPADPASAPNFVLRSMCCPSS
ncbi:MAG: M56 family metallopeptidase, partial [Singulisphaera sp.]